MGSGLVGGRSARRRHTPFAHAVKFKTDLSARQADVQLTVEQLIDATENVNTTDPAIILGFIGGSFGTPDALLARPLAVRPLAQHSYLRSRRPALAHGSRRANAPIRARSR
jgi:hypothetical protein